MTKAQKYKAKAREIMPEVDDLQDLEDSVDSYDEIDEIVFRDNEYLGGMAAVLTNILRGEDEQTGKS